MTVLRRIIVAIDGPAGAGKSSTAKRVAEELGYFFLDTGAMYRAVTLTVLRRSIVPKNESALIKAAEESDIRFVHQNSAQHVYLNDEDVTSALRTPEVTQNIAPVAANAGVRAILVRKQQKLGESGGVVAEGRDIGTVVFPKAELKIFMLASLEVRARRRAVELQEQGIEVDISQLREEIRRRDESDSTRKYGALIRAADAIEVDTSTLKLDQQVKKIVTLARERGA
jgi:cytidylate kinase